MLEEDERLVAITWDRQLLSVEHVTLADYLPTFDVFYPVDDRVTRVRPRFIRYWVVVLNVLVFMM